MRKLDRYSRILPGSQFVLLNLTLGIGHFLVLLNAGAYLPMLPYISASMGVGLSYAVWSQSDYFTAMGSALLIANTLMWRYGPKNTAIFAYLLFAASSFAALLTVSQFSLYLAVRIIQGFAAGMCIIPSFFLLLEYYHKGRQQTAVSLWSLAQFVPFSVGPALGGWFAYEWGDWRLLFGLSAITALLVALILWALLADWEDDRDRGIRLLKPVSVFLFFFAAALALQEFFDVGLLSDLSSRIAELWWLFFAFMLFSWLFWVGNAELKKPLLQFSLFACPNYAYGMLLLSLAFMGIQGAVVQYLIRLQLVGGYTSWHAGLLFLPVFVFSKPLSLYAQKLIRNDIDPRLLASLALAALALGFWWISSYQRPATWEDMLAPQFLLGGALGLLFVAMTALALGHVPKPQQLHAVNVLNTVRNLAAGLAITISDLSWDRLLDVEKNRMTATDVSDTHRFAEFFDHPFALHAMNEKINIGSSWLAFNDLYYFLSIFFIVLAVCVWFASPVKRQSRQDADLRLFENLGEEP
ncbi:MAG: MFS transporter [Burkholderiales bacterium]